MSTKPGKILKMFFPSNCPLQIWTLVVVVVVVVVVVKVFNSLEN